MAFGKNRLSAISRALKRHRKGRDGPTYITHYDTVQLEAAAQALEQLLTNARSALNNAIEGAAPGVFSLTDKIFLVAEVMEEFVLRELGRVRR